MNYYKRHIGDYARDTGHLSALEHGIYTLLLDWYYTNERPIPTEKAFRIAKANRMETETVLSEFFHDTPEGWIHHYADREIADYKRRSEINTAIGKLGGRPRKTETVTERKPNANPATSHKPVTIEEQEHLSPAGDAQQCPQAEIVSLYHELLPANPRMKVWDGERAKALRTRWREDPKRQNLDYWRAFFGHVAKSPFLTGQVAGQGGRAFLPGLDWLLKPANFAKVIEDRYHEKSA